MTFDTAYQFVAETQKNKSELHYKIWNIYRFSMAILSFLICIILMINQYKYFNWFYRLYFIFYNLMCSVVIWIPLMHTNITMADLLKTKNKGNILKYFHLYVCELHSFCGNNKFFMFKVCDANTNQYYNPEHDIIHTVEGVEHLFVESKDPLVELSESVGLINVMTDEDK